MTNPEALQAAPAAELRAIAANSADADLRTRARAELLGRHEQERGEIAPETRQEAAGAAPTLPPMSAAEIRAARRFSVVLYDGRVIA
jgi:hypothetical protein